MVTGVHKGSRKGGHKVPLVDWSRAVWLGAAHGCLGWLSMEALRGSHGLALSVLWLSYQWCECHTEGMKFIAVINENPPLKTITKQKKRLKSIENHILNPKFENSTNTNF